MIKGQRKCHTFFCCQK